MGFWGFWGFCCFILYRFENWWVFGVFGVFAASYFVVLQVGGVFTAVAKQTGSFLAVSMHVSKRPLMRMRSS